MTGGYFKRTYEVWRNIETRDPETGAIINAWSKLDDVPGRAYTKSVTYGVASARQIGTVDWTFACGDETDIEVGDQVRFDGRKLTVMAINSTSRGDRLECLCNEVQT